MIISLYNEMDSKREEWLDALRGIAMIIVIWGHCGKSYLFNAIYLVNVPMFICITGYIYGMKLCVNHSVNQLDFIKVIKKHVFPYLTYGIMIEIVSYCNFLLGAKTQVNITTFFDVCINFIQFEAGTLWFLIPMS